VGQVFNLPLPGRLKTCPTGFVEISARGRRITMGYPIVPPRGGSVVAIIQSVGRLVRVILRLAVFTILTVLLGVPALFLVVVSLELMLAVLIIAIPLLLIALVLWSPYLAVARDRRAAWANMRTRVHGFGRWLVAVPLTGCVRLGGLGIRAGRALLPKALPVVRRARPAPDVAAAAALAAATKRDPIPAPPTGSVLLEMIAGAAVGTILVCLIDPAGPRWQVGLYILGGAVVGATLGLFVARARTAPTPEQS
jgi:hypothetical protein